jgi:hypothetical protein
MLRTQIVRFQAPLLNELKVSMRGEYSNLGNVAHFL